MTFVDVGVIAAGAALIAGELWFFLGPRRRAGPRGQVVARDGHEAARANPGEGRETHG